MKALVPAALMAAFSFVTTAQAQPACGEYPAVAGMLTERFGEEPVSRGLTRDGMMLEIWASVGGTWSALIVGPDGTACIVSEGLAFEAADPVFDPAANNSL